MDSNFEKFMVNANSFLESEIKNDESKKNDDALLYSYIIDNKDLFRRVAANYDIDIRHKMMHRFISELLYKSEVINCDDQIIYSALTKIGIETQFRTMFKMFLLYFTFFLSITFVMAYVFKETHHFWPIIIVGILVTFLVSLCVIFVTDEVVKDTKFRLFTVKK